MWDKPSHIHSADIDETKALFEEFDTFHRDNAIFSQEVFVDKLMDNFEEWGSITQKQFKALQDIIEQIEDDANIWI